MVVSATSVVSCRMLRRGRDAGDVVLSRFGRLMKWLRVRSWQVGQMCSKPSLAEDDADTDDREDVSLLSSRQARMSSCPHSDRRDGASMTCNAMYSTSRPRLGQCMLGDPSREACWVGLSYAGATGMFGPVEIDRSSGEGARRG